MSEGSVFRRADGRWVAKYKDAKGTWPVIVRRSSWERYSPKRACCLFSDVDFTGPPIHRPFIALSQALQMTCDYADVWSESSGISSPLGKDRLRPFALRGGAR